MRRINEILFERDGNGKDLKIACILEMCYAIIFFSFFFLSIFVLHSLKGGWYIGTLYTFLPAQRKTGTAILVCCKALCGVVLI